VLAIGEGGAQGWARGGVGEEKNRCARSGAELEPGRKGGGRVGIADGVAEVEDERLGARRRGTGEIGRERVGAVVGEALTQIEGERSGEGATGRENQSEQTKKRHERVSWRAAMSRRKYLVAHRTWSQAA
jgi:hypothetical protein